MAIEPATTTPLADRGGNNLSAMGYMLLAVLGFSLTPLFIDLVAGFQSPFMFNAWFRIGASIGCLLFLLAYYPSTGLGRDSWTTIRSWIFGWPDNKLLLLATVVNLEYALFAWSLRFIGITTAAILFETGPILCDFVCSEDIQKGGALSKNNAYDGGSNFVEHGRIRFCHRQSNLLAQR